MYRVEMNCQIIHDSIHERKGWTREYALELDDTVVGYGSVAVAGPWNGKPTVYEFYVLPTQQLRVFDLFRALLEASAAVSIEVQSNAPLITVMLHTFAREVESESIIFHDKLLTSLVLSGAIFRTATAAEETDLTEEQRKYRGVIEIDGEIAAKCGVLFHYNRPYGDIYMDVEQPYRRRGFGSFLVQELKRLCYEGGHIPAARCHPSNIASQQTLQKAGFVPCAHILTGRLSASV
jgi:GNAT superfamily N-acetyltransferase